MLLKPSTFGAFKYLGEDWEPYKEHVLSFLDLGTHNEENPLHGVDAPQFNSQRYLRELAQLRAKADQFRLQLKTLLTEQRSLTRRFFATLAQEVIGLHQRLRLDAEQWAADALMPLMQHTVIWAWLLMKMYVYSYLIAARVMNYWTSSNPSNGLVRIQSPSLGILILH
jgi:hypothetical protein